MGSFQKILLIINLVVVLAGAGLVYYSHNMIKAEATDQAAEVENLKNSAMEQAQVQAVPMKKFVVNLHSRGTRLRFLDVEMNILPFHNDQKELIKASEYIFKDTLIEIASHLTPEELDTLSGKILLENKIKKQVNAKLGQPVVKQIYFSGFVVQ
ncbi:MAG: flagellar basal body-associated FliL family protein [Bdellovibrionales bacterium]|nr:flagellar basal body-associated FliL family protein [Bdellovibrionales bacterium]